MQCSIDMVIDYYNMVSIPSKSVQNMWMVNIKKQLIILRGQGRLLRGGDICLDVEK